MVQEGWTIIRALRWAKELLLSKGVANGRLEAEWLLSSVIRTDRVGLYLQYDKPLNEHELSGYHILVQRRSRREPLQHILGSQEFYGLEYMVTPDVLVPRYDTEVLVLEAIKQKPYAGSVLDIGTGSGCIAIALQKHYLHAVVTATDISESALSIAKQNACLHGAKVEFLLGSLYSPVRGRLFDLIVSNPPYIPTADIDKLEPEVREYDPRKALDGGSDGLDIYRQMIPQSIAHLNQHGWLLVEIGAGQHNDVVQLFKKASCFDEPIITLDSGGNVRVVGAQLKG